MSDTSSRSSINVTATFRSDASRARFVRGMRYRAVDKENLLMRDILIRSTGLSTRCGGKADLGVARHVAERHSGREDLKERYYIGLRIGNMDRMWIKVNMSVYFLCIGDKRVHSLEFSVNWRGGIHRV
ncbi:hypothetical protein Tco_0503765 [Tanacetum coccineum]